MIALKDWKYMETFTPNTVKQYVAEFQLENESRIFIDTIESFQKEILAAENQDQNYRVFQFRKYKDIDPYIGYFETNGFKVEVQEGESWLLTVRW